MWLNRVFLGKFYFRKPSFWLEFTKYLLNREKKKITKSNLFTCESGHGKQVGSPPFEISISTMNICICSCNSSSLDNTCFPYYNSDGNAEGVWWATCSKHHLSRPGRLLRYERSRVTPLHSLTEFFFCYMNKPYNSTGRKNIKNYQNNAFHCLWMPSKLSN